MVKICVAGATGRMGSTLVREALAKGFDVVGAVASPENPNLGRSLREAGIADLDTIILDPTKLSEAVRDADVYVTFTTPEAEVSNLPVVANLGKRIVMGTTGFSDEQLRAIKEAVEGKVPAVFAPNFAIGVNILIKMINVLRLLPQDYDFSIVEAHHIRKRDAPSGTAKKIGEVISKTRGYERIIYGRKGINPRKPKELEILSVRAGGIPGIHDIIIAGQHEMIKIEHVAFSRRVFAQGALYATEWIMKRTEPRIYTMDDVLSQ